jgi:hypothetical protein
MQKGAAGNDLSAAPLAMIPLSTLECRETGSMNGDRRLLFLQCFPKL